MSFASLDDVFSDYDLLDADDRYRLLIDLGRDLEPMPEALKTEATLVRGCSAAVWVYPVAGADGRLHFLADSNAAITKGIVAPDPARRAGTGAGGNLALDIEGEMARFDLGNQLSFEPHPGHSQHDRAGPRDRRTVGDVSDPKDLTAAFDPERFMSYAGQVGHAGALGIFYHAKGEDWVELGLPYAEHLVGMPASGIIASGPIVSLMDMRPASHLAPPRHVPPPGRSDLRVDYLGPPGPAHDRRPRRILGATKSVGFVRGLAYDGNIEDPVANVTGTFMFTD